MYLISRDFGNHTIPEIVASSEDEAREYVQQNESVFCSYRITPVKVLYGDTIKIQQVQTP